VAASVAGWLNLPGTCAFGMVVNQARAGALVVAHPVDVDGTVLGESLILKLTV